MKLKFYKEDTGEWFVNLPTWEGEKADLQMVCGADTMLDILAQEENVVYCEVDTDPIEDAKFVLTRDIICADEHEKYEADGMPFSGAYYAAESSKGFINTIIPVWLCDVTKFVFGGFPEIIYIY